jgi:hypothetical protein
MAKPADLTGKAGRAARGIGTCHQSVFHPAAGDLLIAAGKSTASPSSAARPVPSDPALDDLSAGARTMDNREVLKFVA